MIGYDKQAAREIVQARLDAVIPEEYAAASELVRKNVRGLLAELRKGGGLKAILSYQALPKWHEVDLAPLEHELKNVQFDQVQPGSQAPLPTGTYDVILVPLYGFNTAGYRLGHGGGWYDRFLATQPNALKIGVGLEISRADFMTEPHDTPMDIIVTERGAKALLPN
jgi:5-formyltetrahydrofolate cyclo-ligase